jgi:pyruvyltransferase
MFKCFWHKTSNVGDTLTPILVSYFTNQKVEFTEREQKGKLVGVGSIISGVRDNDTVWGAGCILQDEKIRELKNVKYLAVRGKLTEKKLGTNCGIYGDPALLLPLIYKPKIKKTRELGYVPHYIDQDLFKGKKIVNVRQNWKDFIDDLLQYERIETSSLHGFIIALAYGVPAKWVKYSDRVIGGGFKFRDFGTGIGLDIKEDVWYNKIENLTEIQNKLINVLKEYVKTTRNQS